MYRLSSKILLGIAIGLTVLGLLLVFSASSTISMLKTNNITSYFNHQIQVLFVAVLPFLFGLLFPYKLYKKISIIFMFIVVFLLIVVLFTDSIKGASRWIDLGFYSFQPSEIAKIVMLIHLPKLITRLGEDITNMKKLLIPLMWIGVFSFLIAIEPNFSNAIITGFLGIVVLYLGGAKFKHLFGIVLVSGIIVATVMWFTPHTHERIAGWLGISEVAHSAPSHQVNEALIGMGSGGVSGVGIGKSQQANLFLPEAYGDFIFAILGEELGFIGAVTVASMYIFFFFMSLITSQHIEDVYGRLIVLGLSFNIVLSAIINIAVVVGLFPTTGIPLPFISFGGSSLAVFAFSVAVILNINADGNITKIFRTKFSSTKGKAEKALDAFKF
jgi:cell division protein FtsW